MRSTLARLFRMFDVRWKKYYPKKTIKISGASFNSPFFARLSTEAKFDISERWMSTLIFVLCKDKGPPVFFDVGVNVGQTLMSFKARFPKGKYFGFEPIPASVHFVQSLIKANDLEDCSLIPVALSDTTQISRIFVSKKYPTGSGSTMQPGVKSIAKKLKSFAATYSLDEIIDDLRVTKIDVIKIDVEGMEPKVLRGAIKTIRNFRPPIVLEVLPESPSNKVFTEIQSELLDFCENECYTVYKVETNPDGGFQGLKYLDKKFEGDSDNTRDRDYVLLPNGFDIPFDSVSHPGR